MPLLTSDELKVLTYVMLLVARTDKEFFYLSRQRLWDGSVDLLGENVDFGTGLPRRKATEALASLAKFGVVIVVRAPIALEIMRKQVKSVRLGDARTIDLDGLKERAKADRRKRFEKVNRMRDDVLLPDEESDRIDEISFIGAPGYEAEDFARETWGEAAMGDDTYFGLPGGRRDMTPPAMKEALKSGMLAAEFTALVDAVLEATRTKFIADINVDVSLANQALTKAQEVALVLSKYSIKTPGAVRQMVREWEKSWMATSRKNGDGATPVPSPGDLVYFAPRYQTPVVPKQGEAPVRVYSTEDLPVVTTPKKRRGASS